MQASRRPRRPKKGVLDGSSSRAFLAAPPVDEEDRRCEGEQREPGRDADADVRPRLTGIAIIEAPLRRITIECVRTIDGVEAGPDRESARDRDERSTADDEPRRESA